MVVVPTRRRLSTLKSALRSLTCQTYPDLRIVVLVNACEASARYVRELHDPRIRVLESEEDLPMAANWERAFLEMRDSDRYVFFMGDDDGLVPGALEFAHDLAVQTGHDVISWEKAEYTWPDLVVPDFRNMLSVPVGQSIDVVSSRRFIERAQRFKVSHNVGPSIYSSFVRTRVLTDLKARLGGTFFRAAAPDVFSSFVIASAVPRFLRCRFALSVNGASGQSNGVAYIHAFDGELAARFLRNTQLHRPLVGAPSVKIVDADALLTAADYLPHVFRYPPRKSIARLVEALGEESVAARAGPRAAAIDTARRTIARDSGVQAPVLRWGRSAATNSGPTVPAKGFDWRSGVLTLATDALGVEDVHGAANVTSVVSPLRARKIVLRADQPVTPYLRRMARLVGRYTSDY